MTVVDTSYVEVAAQDKSSMGIEEPVSQDVVDMTDEEVMKLVGFPLAPAGYEPLFNSWAVGKKSSVEVGN
ncbi:hypothetical protein GGF46_003393 [Coemansia sp. RSA 552]|nr:hypothetical protein GGF46_003393 [Coemansia sp. RSA 552]